MRIVLIALLTASLAGCGHSPRQEAPSAKAVDSAIKAAPDTIKAIPPDTTGKDSSGK